ncbi:SCP2 sterol-binding domain-containing protein [Celeribacter indicus]|uniref:Sterol carrier family protein n=1 Tax=Celeribacter indicus TaxID=1208324 RepID=A0A0B5DW48_9RHOB|nr:SCP2 sterol-binding domain-containing protein [Celeribacter indicus]AJE47244.1 sterol carrier family protein [Celeribacter indicus]SDW01479.1 SCP-2 sterol transfer family protein [Celeribacter indicus]
MTDFLTLARAALAERLKGENFEKTVSLRIRDVGNLLISGDSAEISDARADCAIIADQASFEKILAGELNPVRAAMFGKLRIAGDAKTAMKFGALFG